MTTHAHRYESRLEWQGATAVGYEGYDRTHTVVVPPARTELTLSSDPAFFGDGDLVNPEQLLVAAASSCQLLAFLAIAARSRIDVVAYEDTAEALMPDSPEPMRITQITLRPRIVVAPGTDLERIHRVVEKAHEQCYIANSLNTEILVEPAIEYGRRVLG